MNKTLKYVASSVAVIVIAAVTYLTGSYLSTPKDMVNDVKSIESINLYMPNPVAVNYEPSKLIVHVDSSVNSGNFETPTKLTARQFKKKGLQTKNNLLYLKHKQKQFKQFNNKETNTMKFNIFKIFAHKAQRGLEGLISTKDKIEEIRYQYNKNAANYIKSAEDMLVNAKELKAKFEELDEKTNACKKVYETLIGQDRIDEAKVKYIVFKGMKTARDTIETAWQNTEKQCVQVRDTLKNIDTNKALIEAKLTALQVQIDTLKMCDRNKIGDFGIDCNEMIAEIENEVKNTQFHIEAKQEIAEITGKSKKTDTVTVALDSEFDEVVKAFKEANA